VSDRKEPDWAGAHARAQIASMPAKAAAARKLIESATRLRLAVESKDNVTRAVIIRHRAEWPVLWEAIDGVCESIEGYK
jgi:hypothetical protein